MLSTCLNIISEEYLKEIYNHKSVKLIKSLKSTVMLWPYCSSKIKENLHRMHSFINSLKNLDRKLIMSCYYVFHQNHKSVRRIEEKSAKTGTKTGRCGEIVQRGIVKNPNRRFCSIGSQRFNISGANLWKPVAIFHFFAKNLWNFLTELMFWEVWISNFSQNSSFISTASISVDFFTHLYMEEHKWRKLHYCLWLGSPI